MGGRLYPQLLIFRACRLFNYRFVTLTPMPELIQEINDFFQFLPRIRDREVLLLSHLAPYKTAADAADTEALPDPLWEFWRQQCVTLPEWYIAAADVALYMTSSACAERVFSLYDCLCTDKQESALENGRECSVMMSQWLKD